MNQEVIFNVGNDAGVEKAFVAKAVDPVISNVGTPVDFAAQFPTPLDQTELLALCEEVNLLKTIPEEFTGLKSVSWREMTSLAFSSGTSYIGFSDGACPEEYTHDGVNRTLDLKNIGAKKSLTYSDILHSRASIAAGYGINRLVSGASASSGMPGGTENTVLSAVSIGDLKAKEMQLAAVLVMNGLDRLLATGNATSNPLEFSGIENLVTAANGAHVNSAASSTGTFSAAEFDRFLSEGCAKPTHIFGHPQAIQEMLSGYFQLGFSSSPQQVISAASGNRVVPGFNFAGEVLTGVGSLICVADSNFSRTSNGDGTFTSSLFPLRMTHNGEPLVSRITQIPLSFTDLAPGCTAISFQIWTKTALKIANMCMQNRFTKRFVGSVVVTCTRIG